MELVPKRVCGWFALREVPGPPTVSPGTVCRQELVGHSGCKYCGAPQADEAHRWWVCPRWDRIRVTAGLSGLAQQAAAAHFQPRCLWICGLAAANDIPVSLSMRSSPQLAVGALCLEGHVNSYAFTDGSALHPGCRPLRRAGWGLFFPSGIRACGPLPGPSQTINRAELWALCNFAAARPAVLEAHSDSQVTVSGAKRVARGEIPAINADLWVIYLACRVQHMSVSYVPAHLDEEQAAAKGIPGYLRQGNEEADRLARLGAEGHAVPEDSADITLEQLRLADQVQSLQWQILREACQIEPLRSYRRVPRKPRGACGPHRRRGPPLSASVGAHELEAEGDEQICKRCGRRGRMGRTAKSWRQQPCIPRLWPIFKGLRPMATGCGRLVSESDALGVAVTWPALVALGSYMPHVFLG